MTTPERWSTTLGNVTITCLSEDPNRDLSGIAATLISQGWTREALHPDGVCEFSHDQRRIHIRETATELFGIDPELYEVTAVDLQDPVWAVAIAALIGWLGAEATP